MRMNVSRTTRSPPPPAQPASNPSRRPNLRHIDRFLGVFSQPETPSPRGKLTQAFGRVEVDQPLDFGFAGMPIPNVFASNTRFGLAGRSLVAAATTITMRWSLKRSGCHSGCAGRQNGLSADGDR